MTAGFVLVLVCATLLALLLACTRARRRRAGEPPLVSGWLCGVCVTLRYAADPLLFLRSCRQEHGDVFTCSIAGRFFTFITDALSFPAVLRHSRNLHFQQFALSFSQRVFGHADFTRLPFSESYPEVHSIFRQTLQGPALHHLSESMLINLQAVLDRAGARGQDGHGRQGWQEEGLQSFTSRIMFEAGFLTLFGSRDPPAGGATQKAFQAFDRAFPLLAAGMPIRLMPRTWRAREALAQELLHDELHQRSCVSDLIQRRMEVFDRMRLDERGKARTHVCMLWASLANTLPAAFWSLYHTLRSADARSAARAEISRVLAGPSLTLSSEQLDCMPVLDSIIEEALRLSSASIMIRVAGEDFTLTLDSGATAAVRKGDFVALYPQLTHLDPEIYPDPTEFRFDRFLDEDGQRRTRFFKRGRRLKHYLTPFGSGASECPGRFFALREIKQFLALTLWRYDLQLCDLDLPLEPDGSRAGLGILPPKRDVLLRYRARDSRS